MKRLYKFLDSIALGLSRGLDSYTSGPSHDDLIEARRLRREAENIRERVVVIRYLKSLGVTFEDWMDLQKKIQARRLAQQQEDAMTQLNAEPMEYRASR